MRLSWTALEIPYKGGHFTISAGASMRARTIVVAGRSATGAVGHGEAAPSHRVTGEDADLIHNHLVEADRLLRRVETSATDVPPASPFGPVKGPAACAVDGLQLDLWAKQHDRPLWRLLGMPRPVVPTSVTVSLGSAEAMAKEARGHVDAGFQILKVKLGEDQARDLARLQAIREAAPRATIRIDGNEGWRLDDMVALVPAFAEVGVELIEQPLRRDAADDEMRQLTALMEDHEIAHVLDERVHGIDDVEAIGTGRLAHGINLKLQKAGGLSNGLRIIAKAKDHGLGVMVGCFIETWAGIALALQACAHVDWVDLDGAWLLAEEPFRGVDGPLLERGVLRGSDAPGIGVGPSVGLAALFDTPTTSL